MFSTEDIFVLQEAFYRILIPKDTVARDMRLIVAGIAVGLVNASTNIHRTSILCDKY
jgi:hypothetical protein